MLKNSKTKKVLENLPAIVRILKKEVKQWPVPVVSFFKEGKNAPFKILVSTVLSLRTKDKTTEGASRRLFLLAETPETMLKLNASQIENAIYPVGFYRRKAVHLLEICRVLIERFEGRVPDVLDDLLTLPGVGRKTANLVVTLAYNRYGICVDTHVHRISNRLGLVKTLTPEKTEEVLREILPKRYWMNFNDILVAYGQNLCVPVSPFCSRCKIRSFCARIGVDKSR